MECVEALRQEGYKGKVMIVTAEDDPPYDRTKLSKVSRVHLCEQLVYNLQFNSLIEFSCKEKPAHSNLSLFLCVRDWVFLASSIFLTNTSLHSNVSAHHETGWYPTL